jgi:hypothetical protein
MTSHLQTLESVPIPHAHDEVERFCPACEDFWPITHEFWEKSSSRADGLMRYCKACNVERKQGVVTQLFPDVQSKHCHACATNKPLTQEYWYKNTFKKDGLCSQCKLCVNRQKAERRRSGLKVGPRKPAPIVRSPKAHAKRCGKCNQKKLLTTEFWYVSKSHGDGFMTTCKQCEALAQKERRRLAKVKVG